MIASFLLALVIIAAVGIGLEALDNWYECHKERLIAKVKHWHRASQYIMTHQDWRE